MGSVPIAPPIACGTATIHTSSWNYPPPPPINQAPPPLVFIAVLFLPYQRWHGFPTLFQFTVHSGFFLDYFVPFVVSWNSWRVFWVWILGNMATLLLSNVNKVLKLQHNCCTPDCNYQRTTTCSYLWQFFFNLRRQYVKFFKKSRDLTKETFI